jgi:hypothetical protein
MEKKAKIIEIQGSSSSSVFAEAFLIHDTMGCITQFCSIQDMVSLNKCSKYVKKSTDRCDQWSQELLRLHKKFCAITVPLRREIYRETKRRHDDADSDSDSSFDGEEEDKDECYDCRGFLPHYNRSSYKYANCFPCQDEQSQLEMLEGADAAELRTWLKNLENETNWSKDFFKVMIRCKEEPDRSTIWAKMRCRTILDYFSSSAFVIP